MHDLFVIKNDKLKRKYAICTTALRILFKNNLMMVLIKIHSTLKSSHKKTSAMNGSIVHRIKIRNIMSYTQFDQRGSYTKLLRQS